MLDQAISTGGVSAVLGQIVRAAQRIRCYYCGKHHSPNSPCR